ncbi:MAG: hypothetical protein KAI70_02035 [Candidatus Omnitrophica bacterium]|nr:hypothetical protein [Candidatus Omnitrophota bacterium]
MNTVKTKKTVYMIIIVLVLNMCLFTEYAESDPKVKMATGLLKAGSLKLVGTCTKWIGTAEWGAKTFLRFSGFDEVQASMSDTNSMLEHRLAYYDKVLKGGYTVEELGAIGMKNQEVRQKKRELDKRYEASKKLYRETNMADIARAERTRMISLKNQMLEVEREISKNDFVINSHSRDIKKAQSKAGKKEISGYVLSLRKNISENYTFESDLLEVTLEEVKTDVKDLVVGEVAGTLTAGAVGEVVENTGILPQLNEIVSPENIAAAGDFISNVGSFVLQKTAETADVPLDPTLGEIPDALDDLFGDPAEVNTGSDQIPEPPEQAPEPVVREITDLLNEVKSDETTAEKESLETNISDVQSRVDARRQRRRGRKKDGQRESPVDLDWKDEPVDVTGVTAGVQGIDVSESSSRDLLIEGARRWNLSNERQEMERRRLEREQREAESRVYQAQQKQIQAQQTVDFFRALGAAAQLVQQVQAVKQSVAHSYGHSSTPRHISSGHHDGGKVYKVVHTPGKSDITYVRIK